MVSVIPNTSICSVTHQYIIPTAKPKAGSTKVWGKSIKAPDSGLTDTISANVRTTAITMSPATKNEITQPPDPDIDMSCPEVTKSPMPDVPLNAIAVAMCVSTELEQCKVNG
ncbi:hypothetical protein GJ744_008567 [Endocarpon pusillum]|uniref:Uncharacterized protein n=1 Tax=Endocarpon pusillum TaxID=364733 RepID=A0A8H7E5E9_9EURO|nr:hypothetical protein GJ744_008567 [Endocarpon pusillum]